MTTAQLHFEIAEEADGRARTDNLLFTHGNAAPRNGQTSCGWQGEGCLPTDSSSGTRNRQLQRTIHPHASRRGLLALEEVKAGLGLLLLHDLLVDVPGPLKGERDGAGAQGAERLGALRGGVDEPEHCAVLEAARHVLR
jgi:hypothetical protein